MKLTIDTEEISPDIIGEIYREIFFDQNREMGFRGCYDTFSLKANITPLSDKGVPEIRLDANDKAFLSTENTDYFFTRAKDSDGVILMYYSDGDIFLSFLLPDGTYLVNRDAKKDRGWKKYQTFDEYWIFGGR
jgi:hypothetical protein